MLLHAKEFDELAEVTSEKITKLKEDTISNLIDCTRGKDLSSEEELAESFLNELETAVRRLEYLAGITDCKEIFETQLAASSSPVAAKGGRRKGKGKEAVNGASLNNNAREASLPIDILITVL